MRFELFIALRYLFSRKSGQKFISITTIISLLGVALGVGALIIVMGVMTGFTVDLRDKLISVTSQGIIYDSYRLMKEDKALLQTIQSTPGVKAAAPFIYSELMLSSSTGVKGVIVRGVEPETGPEVLPALNNMITGSSADLASNDDLPGIIIGSVLARHLLLDVGSRVNLLSPTGQQTLAGMTPKIKAFRVVGIFSIGFGEYDSSLAYINIATQRDLMGLPKGTINGIQLAFDDIYKAESISQQIVSKLGPEYRFETWMSLNANLFAALKLEKLAMAIILTLIVIVGCFSIITSLVMLVMEKKRDIAMLISMGATSKNIARIFILQGSIIGFIGIILGYSIGLGGSFLLSRYQFIKLPPGIYSLDYVPVLLELPDLLLTGMGAMLLCFVATLYPAKQAASTDPISILRAE